jgi:hypothetical protein
MFNWWFRSKNANKLRSIQERLGNIEQAVQQMTEQRFKNNIHIDTLHIHNPVLEKLEFRLDQLDIDEMSGALNLGNNFGVRVSPKLHIKRKSPDDCTEDHQSDPDLSNSTEDSGNETTMSKTLNGFTFRFS